MNLEFISQVVSHPDVPKDKKIQEIKQAIAIRNDELNLLNKWLDSLEG